jgi:hypothetical protein
MVAFMSYQSVNPCNGKLPKKFKEITGQQLEATLKTAATCFKTDHHTPASLVTTATPEECSHE